MINSYARSLLIATFITLFPGYCKACDPTLLYLIAGLNPNHEFSQTVIQIDTRLRLLIPILNNKGVKGISRKQITGVFSLWLTVIEKYSDHPPAMFKNKKQFQEILRDISKKFKLFLGGYNKKDKLTFHDAIRDMENSLLLLFKSNNKFSLVFGPELRKNLEQKRGESSLGERIAGQIERIKLIMTESTFIKAKQSEEHQKRSRSIRGEQSSILQILEHLASQTATMTAGPDLNKLLLNEIKKIEQHERKILYYQNW